MPLICCTKKLIAEIGTPVAKSAEKPHAALLGDWYANLLRIDRRKCVIFTSERTLLTFVVVALNRDAIRDYVTLFQRGLRQLLECEGFAAADVDRVLDDYQELTLAPTRDRSVLGSLNDLARMAAAYIEHGGGVSGCDPGAINHKLNQTPMSRLGMESPLATTRRVLERGDLAARSNGGRSTRRKKRPGRMELDAVRIERQGDAAILTPRDPDVAVTHFQLGKQARPDERRRDPRVLQRDDRCHGSSGCRTPIRGHRGATRPASDPLLTKGESVGAPGWRREVRRGGRETGRSSSTSMIGHYRWRSSVHCSSRTPAGACVSSSRPKTRPTGGRDWKSVILRSEGAERHRSRGGRSVSHNTAKNQDRGRRRLQRFVWHVSGASPE